MFHSKTDVNHGWQAFAWAIFLALVLAGVLDSTRVQASVASTRAPGMASHGVSVFCAAGLQSRDDYLRQENAVLSKVTQSNWDAAEITSFSGSTVCAAGLPSNEYYLRQEQAVLSRVAQGNWSVAEMAQPAASLPSNDFYLLQEEMVLRKVTQSNWNAAEIASFGGSNFIALASR